MINLEYYKDMAGPQCLGSNEITAFQYLIAEVEAEQEISKARIESDDRVNIFSVGAGMFLIGLLLGFIISIFAY